MQFEEAYCQMHIFLWNVCKSLRLMRLDQYINKIFDDQPDLVVLSFISTHVYLLQLYTKTLRWLSALIGFTQKFDAHKVQHANTGHM